MKILWLLAVIHTAFSQPGFGRSYLRDSRLCHQWTCLNTKLDLPDSLPSPEQFGAFLRSNLPSEWRGAVDRVIDTCYHDRPRRYSNTCPGQAIMHCAVDQLIVNCPESYQRKNDACAPVNSLAGFHYMFTQSRYENIERNIAVERRPEWFLRNYFNLKCCNVPNFINATLLAECGFSNIIQYYTHNPTIPTPGVLPSQRHFMSMMPLTATTTAAPDDGDSLKVVSLKDFMAGSVPKSTDPLDCCDLSDFIQPSWREECSLHMSWERERRLVFENDAQTTTAAPAPTTGKPVLRRDVTFVPHSCEKETCVFTKLNVIKNGAVDIDAFTRLLDNLTSSQPSWASAKGRALTTCLKKPLMEYADECEINKVLTCTFDVLTENCPNAPKNDSCRHSVTERTCQISSSKYRAKNRREICVLPDLVDRNILSECGLTSLSQTKAVTTAVKPKTYKPFSGIEKCKDLTPATTCLLSKMDALTRYGFVDYFKMKDRIRNYTDDNPTALGVLLSAFNDDIMYQEHCNSAKKLLNVLDAMLMTCPSSRKQNTTQCTAVFDQINNSPIKRNLSPEHNQRILNHFLHVFNASSLQANVAKVYKPMHIRQIKKSPIYHYGILNDSNAPKVVTIDVKPKPKPLAQKPPLVLIPVYMRLPQSNLLIRRPFLENGVMRGMPMNNPTNNAHLFHASTTTSVPTTPISTTPVSNIPTTRRISPRRISTSRPFSTIFQFPNDERLDMIKPE